MHKRKQIRDRFTAVLTGLSVTGTNVFASRLHRLSDSELPSLTVYTAEEELLDESMAKGYSGVMELDLRIKCALKENDDFDDRLDAILEEVQAALRTERSNDNLGSLRNLTLGFYYSAVENVEFERGELDQAAQEIIYKVHYEQDL